MSLDDIKYYQCPFDEEDAILLVDVETESIPATDEDGHYQYYCGASQHIFSVDEDGEVL